MKRTIRAFIAALLVASLLPAVVTAQEAEEQPFVAELARELQNADWDSEEIEELVAAAEQLDWEAVEGANPQAVALALQFGAEENSELSGPEQAQLALELAVAAAQMEAVGLDQLDIARAALNGARSAIGEIRTWKDGGREGNLGEIVRSTVAARTRRILGKLSEPSGGLPADPAFDSRRTTFEAGLSRAF